MLKRLRDRLTRFARALALLRPLLLLAWQAHPPSLVGLLLLEVMYGLVPVAGAYLSKGIFDLLAQVFQGEPFAQVIQVLIFLLVIQAIISVLKQLTSPLQEYFQAELGRQLTLNIRLSLYRKLNSLSGLSYFEDPRFHNTLQVVSTRVQFVPMQAFQIFATLIRSMISLITFFAVLVALSPLLALALGVAILPHLLTHLRLSRQHFQIFLENSPQERRASYYGQVLSWINFAKEVRLFQLGEYFLGRFVETTRLIYRSQSQFQLRQLRWQALLALLTSVIATAAFITVVLQAFTGRISLGDMAFYIMAVESVQESLLGIVFVLSSMNEDLLFFQQYQNVLSLSDRIARPVSPRPVPPLSHGITFCDISFRYSEQHPWIVRHLNLFLPAGQCLALVGLNGAGKTTLVKLLTRLYDPTEGKILWDDIDIRNFDPEDYRRHLGAIFQDFVCYELSAQENIGLGETEQIENLSAIQAAARKSGVHERIEALPHGYQSMLSRWLAEEEEEEEGNRGIDLSGGEWQKLALARMFLRNAAVLVLDEPTASLDAQTEYELFHHFRSLMQGHTCLLITHRFSTVRMADYIAVLEDGDISEYGTHEDLIKKAGTYERLYSMQAESYQ